MEHLNLNAHFFKRLIEMGMPGRDVEHDRDHKNSFEQGLVSARAITIGMFVDCEESRRGPGGRYHSRYNSPRVHPKKTFFQPGVPDSKYTITRAGFLCRDVNGSPFVLVGCEGRGYHELFYSIENRVTLAIPFGTPNLKRRRNSSLEESSRINADEARRVKKFVQGASNSSTYAFVPREEGTLSRRANDVLFQDMLSLAERYETMRCIWPENKAKSRLVVITGREIFVMSKKPYSKLIRDFPRYKNRELIPYDDRFDRDDVDMYGDWLQKDPTTPPTNEDGTYYHIDKVESMDEGPDLQQTFVAAAVDYCGFQDDKKKVQPIKFIRPNGDVSTILADFAFAFD